MRLVNGFLCAVVASGAAVDEWTTVIDLTEESGGWVEDLDADDFDFAPETVTQVMPQQVTELLGQQVAEKAAEDSIVSAPAQPVTVSSVFLSECKTLADLSRRVNLIASSAGLKRFGELSKEIEHLFDEVPMDIACVLEAVRIFVDAAEKASSHITLVYALGVFLRASGTVRSSLKQRDALAYHVLALAPKVMPVMSEGIGDIRSWAHEFEANRQSVQGALSKSDKPQVAALLIQFNRIVDIYNAKVATKFGA